MKRKKMIFLTSLIIFVPMIVGLIFWNKLPEELPVHFNAYGEADNWESKAFVVFFFPLFLFAMHLLTSFITLADPKKQNISDKMFLLVLCIIPFTAILLCILTYSAAFGVNLSTNMVGNFFLGLLFIIIGNYLPKSRQNYTIGIKLPWTLCDTENWNKTHRFGGILWLLCGILALINIALDITWLPLTLIFTAGLVPTVYSFLLYKRKKKDIDTNDGEI